MGKAKKLLIVGGVFVVGAVLLVTGWIEYRNSKKLAAEGKAVTADVVSKDIERGRRGRKSYYLEVQFPTESGPSSQRVRVSSSQYDAANPGGTVPAHYLPGNPKVCQVGGTVQTEWSGLAAGFGAWVLSAILGFSKTQERGEGAESSEGTASVKPDLASGDSGSDNQEAA
jgi:hypothetical protein